MRAGIFLTQVQAREMSMHYQSHALIWLGDNPGGVEGNRKKVLLFPFKWRKGYIPPEFIPKLPSDPHCTDTVKNKQV